MGSVAHPRAGPAPTLWTMLACEPEPGEHVEIDTGAAAPGRPSREEGMGTTPQEPMVQPDSLVQAQLSPDRRAAGPGAPARLTLVVDNHDRRSRAVQLQLGGPMSR